jgi:hypothetical protein
MKTRIALGATLLLTIGTAVAGSMIYKQGRSTVTDESATPVAAEQVTPEVIALWKATASSSDYAAPRIPI